MTKNTRVLLATTNRGKLHEMSTILGEPGIRLVTTSDVGIDLAVDETGSTYVDNAVLKARAYAAASGLITLGDDSGLEVDALDGAPGVRAARIAGPGATDADRYNLLLSKLEGVPADRRTARFRCAVALAAPAGQLATAEGACEGRIAFRPAGKNGFGYDPVFYLDEYGRTMAELPDEIKNTISHRARALKAARPLILAALKDWADPH